MLALHVFSDVIIGLSYYSIPLALLYFIHKRRDVAYGWVFLLFAAFILACGTTHLFDVWTLWNPDYGVEGLIKAVTALVSLLTAITLWLLMPRILALPSPRQLEEANLALQQEIAMRRATEERYTRFFTHLAEGLFVVTASRDGSFAFDTLNPAYARATGLDPAMVAGRPLADVLPPDTAARLEARFSACAETGQPMDFEDDEPDLPVGRRVWHTVLVPVADDSGRIVQILGSSRDITERHRLHNELVQASKMATLGTLAAGLAHEMSQPLNIIRMWGENALARLRGGMLDTERTEKVLGLICGQTERMGRIIDHMRLFSRQENPTAGLINPTAAATAAVQLVEHQYGLENITVTLEPGAGGTRVIGSALQLEQVMLNLLSNARDAIAERRAATGAVQDGAGAIALSIDEQGGHVRIRVDDDGGGIPPAVLPRLFDPFFTTKDVGKGTGLGLSISYGIIESMNGRIDVMNLIHGDGRRGARFTITLPLAPPSGTETASHA
ncbi:PAS domain S-box-containing protein [Azospirillum fermentarium]|uniref:ATP-binding protein n=1 Tax=Azospirillum fermentarium TaxID=1233114 RepID=UPI002227ADAD|nr:ATP-binding protein [Azospirillum fermentarium]MCW2247578.1 PAS domain S-box-containing protein [Azospirillum fermentarium]